MADKQPTWKMLGATYGNRAGQLLAEMATHAAGMQAALDELTSLLDLPPNHALSSRQLIMLVKDEAVQAALAEAVAPELQPLPEGHEGKHASEVLEWVRRRCTVLAGTVGGSIAAELHAAYLDDDGTLGLIQFSRALRAIGPPLRRADVWGERGRGTVRRCWNLAPLPKAPWTPPAKPTKVARPLPDWIDGGAWPGTRDGHA